MRTPTNIRRYILGFTMALALPLGLGALAVAPMTAQASTPTAHPYFTPWKLGTPLPVVPAGSTVEALPSQASMAGIQHGTELHMTPVSLPTSSTPAAAASAAAVATTALAPDANSAGYVNLEVIPGPDPCGGIYFNYDEGHFVDAVAQSYSTDAYDNQSFTYGTGQSSSVAIGLSTTNQYGSFSYDGTTSVSTSGSVDMPTQSGKTNNYWRTEWEWGNYDQYCPVLGGYYYYSQPYQWLVGSDNIYHPAHVGSYNPNACGEEQSGTTVHIDQSSAKTIDDAFSVLGFGGSSQTGYQTSAQINLHFGEHGYNCGTELYPHAGFDYPVQIP